MCQYPARMIYPLVIGSFDSKIDAFIFYIKIKDSLTEAVNISGKDRLTQVVRNALLENATLPTGTSAAASIHLKRSEYGCPESGGMIQVMLIVFSFCGGKQNGCGHLSIQAFELPSNLTPAVSVVNRPG